MDVVAERKRIAVTVIEPPRCSDYDTDCAGVMDHAACHRGHGPRFNGVEWVSMDPADGYCPYLGKQQPADLGARGESE